ncbi:MAG: PAS domain S-box protein [Euryarchaeota archaeon]|nr:PAS domain S-box protein [Euryarchaeota archaeon]
MIRLLIVDDEPLLLELTKIYLEKIGDFTVDTAASACEALEMIKATRYDAIVSDYQMPEMDGIEFLKAVRGSGSDIPFIIFTGKGREDVVIEAINNGADFYLQKGGNPKAQFAELSHKIRHAVRGRESEKALKEINTNFNTLIEAIPDVVYFKDAQGRHILVNQTFEKLVGLKKESIIGKTNRELLPPDLAELCDISDREVIEKHASIRTIEVMCDDQGRTLYYDTTKFPVYDENGNIRGIIGTSHDITVLKQAEMKIQQSEIMYRTIFESTSAPTMILDEDMTIVLANSASENLLGYSKEEMEGKKSWTGFVVKEDLDSMREYHRLRRSDTGSAPENYEFGLIDKSGNLHDIYLTVRIIPGTKKSVVSLLDITTRKQVEEALRESEEKYRDLFENANDLIQSVTQDGHFVYVNRAWRNNLGYTEEEIADLSLFDIIHPDSQAHCMEVFQRVMSGEKVTNVEAVFVARDGKEISVAGNVNCKFVDGKPIYTRGIFRDITEWKQIDEKLAKIARRFQTIFNSVNDGLAIMDRSLTVREVNDYRLRALGLKINEVIGRKCYEVFQHRDQPCEICPVQPVFEKGEMVRLEKSAVGKDGAVKYFDTQGTPISDGKGNIVQVISSMRDITDRKAAEQALEITNKKLQLLSGITRHDIFNQITGLAGYTDLIGEIMPDDSEVQNYLDNIIKLIATIEEQVRFTADYEELGMQPFRWQRVGDMVERAASGYADCGINVSIGTGTLEVFTDPMLEKIFFNLFDNAVRHGKHVTEISVTCREEGDGRGMVITVEDNGAGIPAEMKEKIFERGVGSNTGYGLFLTHEVLAITGMSIRETGEEGKGARFEIIVPPGGWRGG